MNVKNWSIRLWPLCIVTYVTFAVLFGRHFLAPGGIQKRLETSNPDPTDFLLDNLESLATHEKFIIRSHCQKQVRPLFDRLVFILIDAFRADFVSHIRSQLPLSSPIVSYYLPFVDKLIRDGAAVTAMAEARTPTVTMPRLKAMLSGTQSSFFDLFENLNSKHLQEDNLVSKAYSAGKRLVFYGDDTWLQLFDSTIFIRHNQTNSFFATDYTSVDTNVTENLLPEMDRAHEWDCTFAHYLGVDHIGHSWGGAWSQLMQPKLIEMDAVIERIVQTAAEKYSDMDFLIAIVGDHGMTDVGNHGGNTDPETHTAAVFTSSAMYFGNRERKAKGLPTKTEFIRQSDISVLLSSLLGLGIPSRSEGRFSSRLFDQLTSHKPNSSTVKLCYQLQNSAILRLQLPEVASKFVHLLDAATRNHLNSIRNLNESESSVQRASSMYDQFLHVLQMAQPHVKSEHLDLQSLISFTFAQFAIIVFLLLFTNEQVQIELFTTKVWQQFSIDSTAILYFSAVSSIVQALLLISTSFVDSENYYSMYIALTITVFWLKTHYDNLLTNSNSIQVLALSLIVNHWAVEDRPSLITFFNLNQSDFILPVISFISILALSAHLAGQTKFQFQKLVYCLFGVIISSIKTFHFFLPVPVYLPAQLAYGCIALLVAHHFTIVLMNKPCVRNLAFICNLLLAVVTLLHRPVHLPLVLAHIHLEKHVARLVFAKQTKVGLLSISFTYFALAQSAFFSFGNTNGISSLDMGPGFTALAEYSLPAVAVQVLLSTYSFLLYWILMLFVRLQQCDLLNRNNFFLIANSMFAVRTFTQCTFQLVAIHLRNHLFIWSVICPKLLYELVMTIIYAIIFLILHFTV